MVDYLRRGCVGQTENATTAAGRARYRAARSVECELIGLGQEGVKLLRVCSEVDLEAFARGPTAAGRTNGDAASGVTAIYESIKDLLIVGEDGLENTTWNE